MQGRFSLAFQPCGLFVVSSCYLKVFFPLSLDSFANGNFAVRYPPKSHAMNNSSFSWKKRSFISVFLLLLDTRVFREGVRYGSPFGSLEGWWGERATFFWSLNALCRGPGQEAPFQKNADHLGGRRGLRQNSTQHWVFKKYVGRVFSALKRHLRNWYEPVPSIPWKACPQGSTISVFIFFVISKDPFFQAASKISVPSGDRPLFESILIPLGNRVEIVVGFGKPTKNPV